MTAPVLAFMNNKGGVGKTTLVHHVGAMLADVGLRVLIVDGDPQANLTAACLFEDRIEEIWEESDRRPNTLWRAIQPIFDNETERPPPICEPITERLWLLPGDMTLSKAEDTLGQAWLATAGSESTGSHWQYLASLWGVIRTAASIHQADVVLLDLGPNLGSLNRAALLATDGIVVPVAADLFSIQGLRNLGPRVRGWRDEWTRRRAHRPAHIALPPGTMKPLGYVLLQHTERQERTTAAYQRFAARMPEEFHRAMLHEDWDATGQADPYLLGKVRHYRGLMAMAHDARKTVFNLVPADGAVGSYAKLAHESRGHFLDVAAQVVLHAGLGDPRPAARRELTRT